MIPIVAASEIGGSLNIVDVIDCNSCVQRGVGASEYFAGYSKSYKIIC